MSDSRRTIGQVIKDLTEEFPDVTVSKIRFLESEGLVEPERSPSGYRKFSENDVARLRYILRLQRDHYMPLKVIRQRMERFDPEQEPADVGASPNGSKAPPQDTEGDLFEREDPDASYTLEDLASASGLETYVVQELKDYRVIAPKESDEGEGEVFDETALSVVKTAKEFAKYGIEPRHLKMYRNHIDREAALFEQAVLPRVGAGGSDRQTTQSLRELTRLSRRMKHALLVENLRKHVTG